MSRIRAVEQTLPEWGDELLRPVVVPDSNDD